MEMMIRQMIRDLGWKLLVSCFALWLFVACGGSSRPRSHSTQQMSNAVTKDSNVSLSQPPQDSSVVENTSAPISVEQYESRETPACVKRLIGEAGWDETKICTVNGTSYYIGVDDFSRKIAAIYSDKRVFVSDPALKVEPYKEDDETKFYVSAVDKRILIDFSQASSVKRLSSLSVELPDFYQQKMDTCADFCKSISYSSNIDIPQPTVSNAEAIKTWLENKTEGVTYSNYFKEKRKDYNKEVDAYPLLFLSVDLKAKVYTERFVTYREYYYLYDGGAHGMYEEFLLSYDHVNQRDIDCNYLFKPESMSSVVNALAKEAKKMYPDQDYDDAVRNYINQKREKGVRYNLPHFGLAEDGIVFSFQAYEIGCYADGSFHFKVPYKRIEHCLTDTAKWCLKIQQVEVVPDTTLKVR